MPLSLGGIYFDDELHYALEIPWGLSLLVTHDPNGEVIGLESVPPDLRPPVNVVHLAYNVMVGLGLRVPAARAVAGLDLVAAPAASPTRRGSCAPWRSPGSAAVVAMEAGWITTEVGRQPWIVYGVLRTADAVSPAPGLYLGFYAVLVIYVVLTVLTVYVLRRLARIARHPGAAGARRARAGREAEAASR